MSRMNGKKTHKTHMVKKKKAEWIKPYQYVVVSTPLPNPSRETKFSGANADREIFVFPVELTTSRIGKLTRLIYTLAV